MCTASDEKVCMHVFVCTQTRDAVLARLIAATHDTASGVSAVACKLISTILTTTNTTGITATLDTATAVSDHTATANDSTTISNSTSSSATHWRHEPQLVHACIQALLRVVQGDISSTSSGSSARSQAVAVVAISTIAAYYCQLQLPLLSSGYSYTTSYSYTLALHDVTSMCTAMIAVAQPHIDSEINSSSSSASSVTGNTTSSSNKSRKTSSSSSSGDAEKMSYSAVRALGHLCILLRCATTTNTTGATAAAGTDTSSNSNSSSSGDQQQAGRLQCDSMQLLTRAVQSLSNSTSTTVSLVNTDVLYGDTTKAVSKHAWCYCKALGTAISSTKTVSKDCIIPCSSYERVPQYSTYFHVLCNALS
jgi:hypothetical protein